MKLNFSFKYGTTDLSHSAWLSDDITWVEVEELYQVVGSITMALAKITEILGTYVEKPGERPYTYLGDENNVCSICDRIFKGPAALKQHRTVMHNGEGNHH